MRQTIWLPVEIEIGELRFLVNEEILIFYPENEPVMGCFICFLSDRRKLSEEGLAILKVLGFNVVMGSNGEIGFISIPSQSYHTILENLNNHEKVVVA